MLLVLFKVKDEQYALETAWIKEIIPALEMKEIVGTDKYIAGIIDYHGKALPIVDLTELTCGEKSKILLGTRIIIMKLPCEGRESLVGLLAEGVTDIIKIKEEYIQDTGIVPEGAPHLGKVIKYKDEIIQCIHAEHLIPEQLQKTLVEQHFPEVT